MSDRTRIWCLRHAESENVTAAVAGTVPASPLTDRGHAQASAAARALGDEPIAAIYVSTALRSRQTAAPLAAARDIAVCTLPDLAEVGIGRAEGSDDPAVRRQIADVLRGWVLNGDLTKQAADGETGHDVVCRISAAFRHIADRHPALTVAVVGHTASLTVGLDRLCALGGQAWRTPLPPAEPFLIETDGHTWHCHTWPGTNH